MNEEQKKKQKWIKYSILLAVMLTFLALSSIIVMDYLNSKNVSNKISISSADLPLDGIDPKEIWVDQMRSENEIVQGKVDYLQEMVVQSLKDKGERESAAQSEFQILRNELENLRAELNKAKSVQIAGQLRDELRQVSSSHHSEVIDPFAISSVNQEMYAPLSSVICQQSTNLHHIHQTIPTGTSVKAILVSSVDMPCSVKGSSDPLPVKLRVIANGYLPHHVQALLKGGIVTASVYGDLSSERVYFRLEKLSQIRGDGHFVETQVAGYVSGEDGKYGLRGTVVDKSCKLIENALLSGFLSGASSFFEAAATARLFPISPINGCAPLEGCSVSWKQSAGQLAVAGGSEGVTNALDALTDYFIKRAEQLRPVIQITAGRIVDITFSDSADLGDLYTHERVRNSGKIEGVCGGPNLPCF